MKFLTPEPRLNEIYRHLVLSCLANVSKTADRPWVRPVHATIGPSVWAWEFAHVSIPLASLGYSRPMEKCLRFFVATQPGIGKYGEDKGPDGEIKSNHGCYHSGNARWMNETGSVLWALAASFRYSRNAEWLKANRSSILAAWGLDRARASGHPGRPARWEESRSLWFAAQGLRSRLGRPSLPLLLYGRLHVSGYGRDGRSLSRGGVGRGGSPDPRSGGIPPLHPGRSGACGVHGPGNGTSVRAEYGVLSPRGARRGVGRRWPTGPVRCRVGGAHRQTMGTNVGHDQTPLGHAGGTDVSFPGKSGGRTVEGQRRFALLVRQPDGDGVAPRIPGTG